MNLHTFGNPKKARYVSEKNCNSPLSKKGENCNNFYLYRRVEAMLEKKRENCNNVYLYRRVEAMLEELKT